MIFAFYRKALTAAGWEATTDKPFSSDSKDRMIFRNPAKDLLEIETYTVDEKLRVIAKQQSAAELAELEQQIKAEVARKNREQEKVKSKREAKVAVQLPAGAKDVKQKKNEVEFTLGTGKAKAAVGELRKQFAKAGWKEEQATVEIDMASAVSLVNEDQEVSTASTSTPASCPPRSRFADRASKWTNRMAKNSSLFVLREGREDRARATRADGRPRRLEPRPSGADFKFVPEKIADNLDFLCVHLYPMLRQGG